MQTMPLRSVATKTLHDYRRTMIFWGVGLFLTALMMMSVYPSVKRSSTQLSKYVANMPEAFKAMFGLEGMDYTSPQGYLNTELFSVMLPVAFAVFAIGAGSRALAGEEDAKTLDLLLSTPTRRRTVVVHKFAAMVADLLVLTAVLWLSLWVTGAVFNFSIGPGDLLAASLNCALVALSFGSVALLAGAWHGGRGLSMGIAAAALVAAFLLKSLGQIVDALNHVRWLSPFYWYDRSDALRHGLGWESVVVMLCVALILLGASVLSFERRDLHA
jgi:ABC-2 type transport system permease protein